MNKTFQAWQESGLIWLPEKGMGYYPVAASDEPYDQDYFSKYKEYAETEFGRALTDARVRFVGEHWGGALVDVGIGCGQFIEARRATLGYDVNPVGVDWLKKRRLWCDPTQEQVDAVSFWDSLEHIPDPAAILRRVRHRVFVSLPIFEDCNHVLRSKHFRKDEHRWYWTRDGFARWMLAEGWQMIAENEMESDLGREDIGTFAFDRAA